MLGIGRRAVLTDRRTRGIVGVEAVVTLGTQRAKLTEPERVVVAAMGLDVICDGCGHHAAGLKADAAQRFGVELMTTSPFPARGTVPTMNYRTMWHWSPL
jgi:hypothetical protein